MQMWGRRLTYFKQDQMHGFLFLQKYRKHLYTLPSGIGESLLQGSTGPESTNLIVVPAQRWATIHPKLQFTRLLLSIQHCSAEAKCKLKQNKNQGIAQQASTCLACTGALGSHTTKWGKKSHNYQECQDAVVWHIFSLYPLSGHLETSCTSVSYSYPLYIAITSHLTWSHPQTAPKHSGQDWSVWMRTLHHPWLSQAVPGVFDTMIPAADFLFTFQ